MYGRRLVCWRRRRIHVAAASRILDAPHGAKADYTVGLQDYGSVHKASSTGEGKNCTWVGGVFHPPGDCFVTKFSLHLKLVQGEVHDEPTFGSTASFDASPPPHAWLLFREEVGGEGVHAHAESINRFRDPFVDDPVLMRPHPAGAEVPADSSRVGRRREEGGWQARGCAALFEHDGAEAGDGGCE